ncbi:hypothetical protein [Micromonospora sp. LOL_024]|uniref:hypothetical protein n=1 Tax=Micromonospora sp. LOL_024 TaxID=3345412 RepID=UPI003A897164
MRGLRLMLRRSVRTEHDRLLDFDHHPGARQSPPGAPVPLASLLRAAAAPPRERELAGEEAALAAFRAARRDSPVGSSGARSVRRRFTAGATAWIAGLVATVTAGAALAASGPDRPEPPPPASSPTAPATSLTEQTTSPVVPAPTLGDGGHTGDRAGAPTTRPSAGPTYDAPAPVTPTPDGSAQPDTGASGFVGPGNSASITDRNGLCRAYLAKPQRQRERALRTPAFAELVAAAGGAELVEAYCRDLRVGS